jgi:hypothetical protein
LSFHYINTLEELATILLFFLLNQKNPVVLVRSLKRLGRLFDFSRIEPAAGSGVIPSGGQTLFK